MTSHILLVMTVSHSLSLGLHVTSSFPKIQNQRVSKVIILIRYERGKIYICFSKTDSMNIDALSTKLTLNPNPSLLPNIFCRHAIKPVTHEQVFLDKCHWQCSYTHVYERQIFFDKFFLDKFCLLV